MRTIAIILTAIVLTSCSVFKGVVPGEAYQVYDVYLNSEKYSYKYKVEVYLVKAPNANNTYFMTNDSTYYPGQIIEFCIIDDQPKLEQ